ncbi:hypothetical protein LAZ67_17002687 [Cordylochernes scorpioides]|uniref:Uncharacterized protein n=1 Tax=Cordylochernes scorpioides TaxID=51811 RepID=A0ABY6LE50_9ARAC|nr:hypothetical protein LAZ67_17002687 [Cordylochernes scorpioides]
MVWAESPSKAEDKPVRLGSKAQPSAEITAKDVLQINSSMNSKENENYVNPPAGSQDANSAAPVDLAAIPTANAAAQVRRNWADITEEVNPGAEEGFTLVQGRKRRRGSANSPTAAAPSSNAGGSRTIRRPQPSAGSVPRAQEIRVTRAHIAEARARQASSSEEHCVYIEHSPELEPFHYLRALDRMLGGTAGVIQITKVNGHQLLGLTNRGLAERLISEGLEVEGTLLRAFPFRKRAERITVGNLPFFIGDSAVINALSPYGRVTSIAPKQMKAGSYVYVDGRRNVFITLHEGITIERLPTRLDINIKGEAWPAYLSSGIRCSRCHGQGHRRAICPLLAGLANNTRMAPPTTPAGVPPPTTPAPPQRSAAQPPAPTPSNPAMEVCSAPPVARAVLHSSAPRPSPPAAPAFPMEETPPAPPPVTPAPSLRTPGSREPAAPTPDVEMSIVEETFASSTSSAKNATRVDLDASTLPSVSFAKTDALGLGREEVLDLLSSRTKAQRKGPLLSPPQCDALVGLIGQILDLKPGHTSNLYKVLGQVRAELTKTPAAAPTPPLPAPRPDGPIPPPPHGDTTTPDMATSPSPLSTQMDRALMDKRWEALRDLMHQLDLEFELDLEHRFQSRVDVDDIIRAILYPGDREPLIKRLPTRDRYTLGNQPVSSYLSLGNQPVSSYLSLGNQPVSSYLSLGNQPVSSYLSLGNQPVSSYLSLGNQPVSSYLSLGNQPVSSYLSLGIQPVSSYLSLGNQPVSSYLSLGNLAVSSYLSLGNQPVSSYLSLGNQPVSSYLSLGNQPVSSYLSLGNQPVSSYLSPEDADYQRILWKPSPEEPVVDYRLLTVTYGTTSAPFLAMRTLQQLAEDEGHNYPEASRATLNDFYVDDLLTGAQTIAETKELIDQLKDLMKKGGFHLRKWNSNCHEIVSHVEEINEERKINLEKGAISKILGIVWDHLQDTFRVNITLPEEVVTKRDLLSNIARIFDPIGFLSPTTVAMANLQRQTAVKEVEDLEGLPVYHRAILKENGEWPEVTKAIQCSYPKVFVGDGTHLYLLIEDVESLDDPNVRSIPGGVIQLFRFLDWVRAVFVHAGKESKYLWKLNLKSKQWTELPTYVKYRDSQYTAVALDLVFILGPADKEHETAEKYLSFFKTRRLIKRVSVEGWSKPLVFNRYDLESNPVLYTFF